MHNWQKIITPALASVGSLLKLLESAFDELSKVLADEYAAIRDHNIKKLEDNAHAKTKASERVEKLLATLGQEIGGLAEAYRAGGGEGVPDGVSLTSLRAVVEGLDESPLLAGSPYQVTATREAKRLRAQIELCQEKFAAIKIETEKNRFVLGRLLHNHQQSYKFWQSTVAEASGSYDRSGHRRSPNAISQFHTKV